MVSHPLSLFFFVESFLKGALADLDGLSTQSSPPLSISPSYHDLVGECRAKTTVSIPKGKALRRTKWLDFLPQSRRRKKLRREAGKGQSERVQIQLTLLLPFFHLFFPFWLCSKSYFSSYLTCPFIQTLEKPVKSLADLKEWNFDGSSTSEYNKATKWFSIDQ